MDLKINTPTYTNHQQLVERYIQALSHAISTGILRPDQIGRVQARLDHIELDLKRRTGTVADSIYGPMLELQALIYLASNRQHLVPACIDELENLPKEYTVRSQVFGEFAQNAPSSAPTQKQSQPKQSKTRRRGRKLAVISVVVLLLVGMAGFMTVSGKMNPVTLAKQYSLSKSLSSQYQACSNELSEKRAHIDTDNPEAISQYNDEFADCEKIRDKQNTAADNFHALLGRT